MALEPFGPALQELQRGGMDGDKGILTVFAAFDAHFQGAVAHGENGAGREAFGVRGHFVQTGDAVEFGRLLGTQPGQAGETEPRAGHNRFMVRGIAPEPREEGVEIFIGARGEFVTVAHVFRFVKAFARRKGVGFHAAGEDGPVKQARKGGQFQVCAPGAFTPQFVLAPPGDEQGVIPRLEGGDGFIFPIGQATRERGLQRGGSGGGALLRLIKRDSGGDPFRGELADGQRFAGVFGGDKFRKIIGAFLTSVEKIPRFADGGVFGEVGQFETALLFGNSEPQIPRFERGLGGGELAVFDLAGDDGMLGERALDPMVGESDIHILPVLIKQNGIVLIIKFLEVLKNLIVVADASAPEYSC